MGSIGSNYGQYQQYKYQARAAESQGQANKTAAYKAASNLEEESRAGSHLSARNMMRARENQTAATASVRARQSASGLTGEGSGNQAEIAIADVLERQIGDMALSNTISDKNKRYAAEVARFHGDLNLLQGQQAAGQLRSLGKGALGASLFTASETLYGGITGGFPKAYSAYSLSSNLASSIPGSINQPNQTGNFMLGNYLARWT